MTAERSPYVKNHQNMHFQTAERSPHVNNGHYIRFQTKSQSPFLKYIAALSSNYNFQLLCARFHALEEDFWLYREKRRSLP